MEIEEVEPFADEDAGLVYLYKIKTQEDLFFTYRIAFSENALGRIDEPVEDALRQTQVLLDRGLHGHFEIIRTSTGYADPEPSNRSLKKHSDYYKIIQ